MICPRTSIGSGCPDSISGRRRPWAASRAVYSTPLILTRSPAVNASTSASSSGGTTALMPSAPILIMCAKSSAGSQHGFLVPMRVTLDGDRDRKRGDVAGIRQDVDAERRGIAAVSLGPDAEAIGSVQHFALERIDGRVRVGSAELTEERFFRKARRLLERAADTDSRDQRRAGVRPGRFDALEDPGLDALRPLGRRQHLVLRAILAATPLRHDLDLERGASDQVHVDDGRRIVTGVHAIERGAHDRRAQVAFLVALPDAFV